jgi:hypothetical protein
MLKRSTFLTLSLVGATTRAVWASAVVAVDF